MGTRFVGRRVAPWLFSGTLFGFALFACGSSKGGGGGGVDASADGTTGSEAGSPEGSVGDGGPTPGPVTFTIDMSGGPQRQFQPPTAPAPVSAYIYGINASAPDGTAGAYTHRKTQWGLVRRGGNSTTTWNWTNNYRNLGNVDCYAQGVAGGGSAIAGSVVADSDSIPNAQAVGAAYLATVPIVDFVAAAVTNDTSSACPASVPNCSPDGGILPGMTMGTGANSKNLAFASQDGGSPAFVANAPRKPGAFCTGSAGADAGCTLGTSPVYEDEFVNFVRQSYGAGPAPVFFSLDNEPNYWGYTHPEVWPFSGEPSCNTFSVTDDDIVRRDVSYASAIKAAWPTTKVFGPVVSQDGIIYAHSYNADPHYPQEFADYYLQQMAAASAEAGTPLLDAFDVHYYNENDSPGPEQCVQSPRMFWDTTYTSISPSDTDNLDFGWAGDDGYFDNAWYPRRIIPRLENKIAAAFPAGAPGLSFSEYNSGCETTIAGGVAEADDLGIFGREGVYAAAAMPLSTSVTNYLVAAFDLYRNYDGNGATVGDTAVSASTSNVSGSSVYAFAHSTDPTKVELVAINKTPGPSVATITVAHAPSLTTVTAYDLVDGSASVVAATGTAPSVTCTGGSCTLEYTMPPTSATTLVLR